MVTHSENKFKFRCRWYFFAFCSFNYFNFALCLFASWTFNKGGLKNHLVSFSSMELVLLLVFTSLGLLFSLIYFLRLSAKIWVQFPYVPGSELSDFSTHLPLASLCDPPLPSSTFR